MKFLLILVISFSAFGRGVFVKNRNTSLDVASVGFRTSCAAGLIEGCKVIRKFGKNDGLASDVKRDVWNFGEAGSGNVDYTYPADGTAPINTISSSSALDLQNIAIFGLDVDGNDTEQLATLNGQNKVVLTTPLWRVHRVINLQVEATSDRTKGFNGNIYIYEDTAIVAGVPTDNTKVRAFVFDGDNQTQMTHYTIPNGFTGLFISGSAKLNKRQAAAVKYELWARDFGSVFKLFDTNALNTQGTGSFVDSPDVPVVISPKTDLVFAATSDSSDTGIAISYVIMLLENKVFGL